MDGETTPENDESAESPIQQHIQRVKAKRKKAVASKVIKAGLGTRLREWRKAGKLNLSQLAKKLKIGITTISEIENNKTLPSAETLACLHKKTNLNILYLMFKEGDMLQRENEDQVVQAIKPKKVIKQTIFNMKLPIGKKS